MKEKMRLLILLIGVVAVTTLWIGCDNAPVSGGPEGDRETNPHEWMGDAHSEGLDYGIARMGSSDKISRDRVLELTRAFMREKEPELVDRGYVYLAIDYAWAVDEALLGGESFVDFLGSALVEEKISPEFYRFAVQIIELAGNGDLDGLARLEEQVLVGGLGEAENAGILASIAIARGSIRYWSGVSATGLLGKAAWWRRVAKADACGALGGAMAGVVGGAAGMGAGALGGAVGASLGSWLLG